MFFSKIGIQLQITIITIKFEHMNIENMKFIIRQGCVGEIAECVSIFIVIIVMLRVL